MRASRLTSYVPPSWVVPGLVPPKTYLPGLAILPTPIMQWELPESLVPSDLGFRVFIKRDDATGCELSGNKVRKLQFLMAAALESGADSIVTIGGEQSNHARATALAARTLGLEPHLVLRTDEVSASGLGLAGNLLLDRLGGARIWLASKREWREHGSDALVARVEAMIKAGKAGTAARKPYCIPVGGSNGLGTWGYLDAVEELACQTSRGKAPLAGGASGRGGGGGGGGSSSGGSHGVGDDDDLPPAFTDIAVATGSGGTTGGISLGVHLCSEVDAKVHGFSVCDSPDYFYKYIDERVIDEMVKSGAAAAGGDGDGGGGSSTATSTSSTSSKDKPNATGDPWPDRPAARDLVEIIDVQGRGYAQSTQEELDTIRAIARSTGVILDPVYSGKAACGLLRKMREAPDSFRGRDVLFWHTGGLFGIFDKAAELDALMDPSDVSTLPPAPTTSSSL